MEVYRRLFKYIKPYKKGLFFSIVLMLLSGIADVMVSGVIYVTTNGLMNREYVSFKDIPHLPPQFQVTFSVVWVPVIIVVVFVVKGLLTFSAKYIMATVGIKSVRDLQNDMFSHVMGMSCDFFSTRHTGDITSRLAGDVYSVRNSITTIIMDLVKSPVTILCTLPVLFIMGGPVALICVSVFPVVAIPIVILGRKLKKFTTRILESNADIISFLEEILIGIKIVKVFNAEEREFNKFCEITDRICKFNCKSFMVSELQRPLIEIMGAVGVAVTIFIAIKTLPLDRFVTFAGTLYILYEPAKKLSKVNSVVQQTVAAGKRIFSIMDTPPSIKDKKGAPGFDEKIDFVEYENVSFSYKGKKLVLKNISFKVRSPQTIALVGSSGSGKTSLVNLLPRFYDPLGGAVKFNGKDIRDFTVKSIRSNVGLVSQDIILFNGTIRENIAFGLPDASLDEIIEAAKVAHAHNFITELDNEYDTYIGERGLALSGGQRQRISIARAVLKDPQILIFDEATSALDTESEKEVQAAIENLIHSRTVFVIAHRLSTIKNADLIYVLDKGKIVQIGRHNELIEVDGPYKKLYEMQFNT